MACMHQDFLLKTYKDIQEFWLNASLFASMSFPIEYFELYVYQFATMFAV